MKLQPFDLISRSNSGVTPSNTDGVCSSSSSVKSHCDSHSVAKVAISSPILSPRAGGGVGSCEFPSRGFAGSDDEDVEEEGVEEEVVETLAEGGRKSVAGIHRFL